MVIWANLVMNNWMHKGKGDRTLLDLGGKACYLDTVWRDNPCSIGYGPEYGMIRNHRIGAQKGGLVFEACAPFGKKGEKEKNEKVGGRKLFFLPGSFLIVGWFQGLPRERVCGYDMIP